LSSVLILNHEPLTARMPGPSIRNWELARTLAHRHDVTLAAPGLPGPQSTEFKVVGWEGEPPMDLVANSDVVKISGYLLYRYPRIAAARHLVVDLYDPFPLENLHMHEKASTRERYRIAAHDRDVQTGLIRAGDVFLCASDRQRDFWLGWMTAAGRVNPYMHEVDPGLGRFLLVVPFGVPDVPPVAMPPRFRGVVPGIAKDDLIVIWGGGIWNWFDPLSLIRAAHQTRDRLPSLRVLFPATSTPSPDVPPMQMLEAARSLSDELGLTGSRVFFGSAWIPYDEHGAVLLEADIGVSLHQDSVETRFSFRTRVLDYLWAGLPIIATVGDSMADLIRSENLGAVVAPGDVQAVVAALVGLGSDPDRRRACAERSRAAASRFRWSVAAQPLEEYCSAPYPAPDRPVVVTEAMSTTPYGTLPLQKEGGRLVRRAVQVLGREGPRSLIAKGSAYLRKGSLPKTRRG
jgi:glycosyltransferase involved in cell wall biosynthesis